MGLGVIAVSFELILDMLELEGFKILRADSDNVCVKLTVASDCIKSDKLCNVLPVYNKSYGITKLKDILIDGKSLKDALDNEEKG